MGQKSSRMLVRTGFRHGWIQEDQGEVQLEAELILCPSDRVDGLCFLLLQGRFLGNQGMGPTWTDWKPRLSWNLCS